MLLAAVTLAACETPAPAPEPPPAPVPVIRGQDAPPATSAAPSPEAAEPIPSAPAGPVEIVVAQSLPERVNAEQIEKTFRLHRRYFSRAYKDRLHARTGLAGTVSVSFTIRPDGSVQDVKLLESTTRDAGFDARVVRLVSEMNFPPASGSTTVAHYPVVFTPPPPREAARK